MSKGQKIRLLLIVSVIFVYGFAVFRSESDKQATPTLQPSAPVQAESPVTNESSKTESVAPTQIKVEEVTKKSNSVVPVEIPKIVCTKVPIPRGSTVIENVSYLDVGKTMLYEGRDGYENVCTGGKPGDAESLYYRSEPRADVLRVGTYQPAPPNNNTVYYNKCLGIPSPSSAYDMCMSGR